MNGSWMSREVHVQFWERVGVKLPCATHLSLHLDSESIMAKILAHVQSPGTDESKSHTADVILPNMIFMVYINVWISANGIKALNYENNKCHSTKT
jgi:hypothetical protein